MAIHSVSVYNKQWEISISEALRTGFLNFPKNNQIFPLYFLTLLKFNCASYKPKLSVYPNPIPTGQGRNQPDQVR